MSGFGRGFLGSVSPIAQVRAAIDAAGHPALLMVDTISGLASIDFRFDEWGVDVAVSGVMCVVYAWVALVRATNSGS